MSGTLIDEGVATGVGQPVEGQRRDGRVSAVVDRARSWLDRAIPWLTREDAEVDEGGEHGAHWERLAGRVIVGICTLIVIAIINPHMRLWPIWDLQFGWLFRNTTTNGGDMGAHVWLPWTLLHNWFPKFRLSGWSPDWYAGFPVGQYYFPGPSLMVALLNTVLPYNVAFKLVTASGPIALPAAAYVFARGMRAPFPAPPAFAIAALGMLVQTRTSWNIYGGNMASTLAGEYSFEIALAFALFALGALAYTLDTGKRPWLPALLFAAAVMSHVVVAIFVGVAAVLLWLVRSPRRTWPIAVAVGGVSLLLTSVWTVPLLGQQGYTQSMRYAKVFSGGSSFQMPYWFFIPNPVKHTIEGIVRGVSLNRDAGGKVIPPTLWLPWWIWILAGIAIVAAGWYRRRSTFVLTLIAVAFGVFFVQWPEHAVWNTRFLPFWLLTWGFIAAMGAAELLRALAKGSAWAYRWITDGDLQDVRARAWADVALDDDPNADVAVRHRAVNMLAEREFDTGPPGWEPPPHLEPQVLARRARMIFTSALAVLVLIGAIFGLRFAWTARNGNPGIRIAGWAQYNYGGYQNLPAWPEFRTLIKTMDTLPPGRAMWEGGDAVGAYGTTLSPELLPYFTKGRIASMEGLYFESSSTVSFHFMTVSELAKSPSNPVRGLVYGSSTDPTDFALGVKHLQMLGVSYLMLFSKESQEMAADQPDLELVKTVPDLDGADPKGWNVYKVAYPGDASPFVTGLSYEPVVAKVHAGDYEKCWGEPWGDTTSPDPQLSAWECSAAPWFMNRDQLDKVWTASGPSEWERIDIKDLGKTTQKPITPTEVTDYKQDPDSISFHVSEVGKPVLVRTSYFPNWEAHGAKGPYRVAPNFMVVVPTSNDVKLTYGLTGVDWLGRIGTLAGIFGLGALITWKGAERYAANTGRRPEREEDEVLDQDRPGRDPDADDPEDPGDADDPDGEPEPEITDPRAPDPALP